MVSCLVALALPASARAQAIVDLDPATDTVRVAARLDGALTRPASGTAAAIGLRYVREHRAALGLTAADLETLGDAEVETFAGIRQVRWRQAVDGIEVADAELRVSVADDGRVLSVLGSPSSDLPTDTTPRLGKPDPAAELTIYDDRLAYRYEDVVSADEINDVITDADTGRVLKRTNLVKSVDADVWDLHPSVGTAKTVSLDPWLLPGVTTLEGRWVRAFSDTTPNNVVDPGEEITPGQWALTTFAGTGCSDAKPCTWSSANRQANRQQNGNQAFYLANRFRDHLAKAPINFDEFEGADRVILETNDGSGANNANMYTPPEGKSPRMQMFLWSGSGYRTFNSGDDASILFHEYTHGLTGRLVKTPDGVGALSSWQAGAMGEGWSDFYAKDFTVSDRLETDTSAPGEIDMGVYADATPKSLRTGALDCPVGVANAMCPAGGGYTYGDFGKLANGPEVHYDGEIWAQTLWDLRTAIGSADALRLVTAALRLSPPEPTFLDMRNAILVAAAADPAALRAKIWTVFAARGMGFYASTIDGADITPVENFQTPPNAATPRGTITGTVRDAANAPVAGITVSVGGLETGPDKRTAVTRADGTYDIADVPVGTYANIVMTAQGYDRALVKNVTVTAGTPGVANGTVRRNWAVGATLRSTAGSENAEMGCGPKQAFDGLPGSTWSTAQGSTDKELVLQLPDAIDITGFGVDPGAGCGDDEDSATAQFQIAVGPSATGPWTDVVVSSTLSPGHKTTVFPVTRDNVTYVRMLPMTTQTPGASYIDLSEFAVYGTPRAASTQLTSTPPAVTKAHTVTYAFSGGTSYVCKWDAEAAEPCTSPVSRTFTEDGTHRFTVTATDASGTDPTPAVHDFTIDSTAPQIPTLNASTSGTSATLTFTATDATAVTFACVLDGVTTACTSPKTYTGLSVGTHAFTVTATDAAGNSTSRSTPVDTTVPDTTITTKPPAITREPRPTFIFSGGDTYECRLDAATAFTTCPTVFPALADGSHTLRVQAVKDGKTDPTPATYSWVVDTVAPTVAIAGASVNGDAATFTFAATDLAPVTYTCTFDGAAAPCSSPVRYGGLADGPHNFQVTVTDAAGNAASASRAVTVDATAPETSISWGPPPILTTRDFAFGFGASEPATFTCSLDGAPAQPCTSPFALTGLAEGAHSFVVTAIDASGQADPTPARSDFSVVVPGLPPTVSPTPTPTPTVRPMPPPALASASGPKTVSRKTGRVKLALRGTKGAKVAVQAKLGARVVGKTTKTLPAGALSVSLTLDRKRLKVGKTVTVSVKGTGSGMASATRTLRIRVKG